MKIPIHLYHPLNILKPIDQDIWIVDGDLVEMSVGKTRIPFSTRMTVVKLQGNKLWCHSPIAPTDSLFRQLDALGEVSHLVAPNKVHYGHIGAWKKHYPQAKVWLAPGISKRAKSQGIQVPDGQPLTDVSPSDWTKELEQLLFKGSYFMKEAVFFHKTSRTLIVTDMIENIRTAQMPFFYRLLYKFGDNAYPKGKTPRDLRLTFWKGKKEARSCVRQIQAWQPEKLLLSHGDIHLRNAQKVLEEAFKWVGGIE